MFYCGAARLATAAATCVLPVVLRCGAARAATAACTPPVVLPSGGCASCCAVVLPASLLLPLPARHRLCCPPRRRCLHAACTLPAVSPSGGCVSCRAVVLPTLPLLPARCLPCCRRAVACRAALWCCLHHHCHRHLRAACRVAVRRLRVVPRCGAARLATTACALPAVSPSGSCVLCCTVVL